jgi:hypothetical protein
VHAYLSKKEFLCPCFQLQQASPSDGRAGTKALALATGSVSRETVKTKITMDLNLKRTSLQFFLTRSVTLDPDNAGCREREDGKVAVHSALRGADGGDKKAEKRGE